MATVSTVSTFNVGAAEGCDLLIFGALEDAEEQKIAACGSSYRLVSFIYQSTLKINLTNKSSSETLPPHPASQPPTKNKRGAYGRVRQARVFLRGSDGRS
jgi:hypothetical protein